MCEDCGCGDTNLVPVELKVRLLASNDATAAHNRHHFEQANVLAINVMGSPGSGKTAVLEATARHPGLRRRIRAVSADLATDNDARRLTAAGIPSAAITTGTACHLDAELVHKALHDGDWKASDWFFIENVGNLVCPAIYDLGQAANVVVISVTEGEDKPLKYPVMFQHADLVLLSKIDLLPYLDFDVDKFIDGLGRVMPNPRLLTVSAKTGEGIADWVAWLVTREKIPRLVLPDGWLPHRHA